MASCRPAKRNRSSWFETVTRAVRDRIATHACLPVCRWHSFLVQTFSGQNANVTNKTRVFARKSPIERQKCSHTTVFASFRGGTFRISLGFQPYAPHVFVVANGCRETLVQRRNVHLSPHIVEDPDPYKYKNDIFQYRSIFRRFNTKQNHGAYSKAGKQYQNRKFSPIPRPEMLSRYIYICSLFDIKPDWFNFRNTIADNVLIMFVFH